MNQHIFTVSELNNQIKNIIESEFSDISVKGEISELNKHISGHMYFSIKDNSSMLRCVMFNYAASLNSVNPKIGDEIIVNGKSSIYIKGGSFQFYASQISLAGKGDLWAKFEAVKKRLLAKGLFDSKFKKDLPKYPRKIAIISSLSGSVIKDIMDVINRNSPYLDIFVKDCRVQGDDAVNDLIEAINFIVNCNIDIDAIIIARGGGSIEDLWCFNSEELAYKIFDCDIPIITGIGHETDTTIADLVSDLRAGTPSIAAEIVAPSINECYQNIDRLYDKVYNFIKNKINNYHLLLNNVKKRHGLHKGRYVLLNHHDKFLRIQKLISLSSLCKKIESKRNDFMNLSDRINVSLRNNNQKKYDKVQYLSNYISSFNPQKIMSKGYSIVYNSKREIIKNVESIENKDKLHIKLHKGELEVETLKKIDRGKKNGK